MATNSGWSKSVPSGSSQVAQGDDELRSFKSYMQEWWEEEHYATDGSTLSAGVHKQGSARAYVGTASQLSNPTGDNAGKLFYVTDTGELRAGNASTSSWSVAGVSPTVANTWTALQTFSDIAATGIFSGITIFKHTLSGDLDVASGGTGVRQTAATGLAVDDFIVFSYTSLVWGDISGGQVYGPTFSAAIDNNTNNVIGFVVRNDSDTTMTFPSGTTINLLSFEA